MKKRGAKGVILKAKSGRQPNNRVMRRKLARAMDKTNKSLKEKAEAISSLRTEIAGEVNTEWTPLSYTTKSK